MYIYIYILYIYIPYIYIYIERERETHTLFTSALTLIHVRLKAVSPHCPGLMKARAALEEDRATSREMIYSELSKAVMILMHMSGCSTLQLNQLAVASIV